MKATEFMIGDWVLYGRRFAIIKELYNGYVTILCSNNGQNEYVEETYDNIKPIPLTETMLIKHFPDTSILTWRPSIILIKPSLLTIRKKVLMRMI